MKLSDLKAGECGQVTNIINSNPSLRKKLLDMGITKGTIIKIKKISPFGDPISIELRGYQLCLRKSSLEQIEVNKI